MSDFVEKGGWVPVLNRYSKQSGSSSRKLFTLFVDNLPDDVSQNWLRKTYRKFGVVRDVFIPSKRSKVTGRNFGFIRYDSEKSAEIALARTNGIWIEDRKLFVKVASFDKRSEYIQQNADFSANCNGPGPPLADASKKGVVNPSVHNVWARTNEKSFAQAVNGQAVRKMQEKTPSNCGDKVHLSPQVGIECIDVQPTGYGWLHRSAIGKLSGLLPIQQLQEEFEKENIKDAQIKAMGGRFLVITFKSIEVRDEVIKKKWLESWFHEIKPWDGEQAKDERFAWIACYGMPLIAWSVHSFKKIGDKWGHFLAVDDNTLMEGSYEKGRFLIATKETRKIEGYIQLQIEGKIFRVRVEEDESFRIINSSLQLKGFGLVENSLPLRDLEAVEKDMDTGTHGNKSDFVFVDKAGSLQLVSNGIGKYAETIMEEAEESNIAETPTGSAKGTTMDRCASLPPSQNSINEALPIHNDITMAGKTVIIPASENEEQDSSWSELPFHNDWLCPLKKKVVEKNNKRLKNIDDLLGRPKARKGRKKRNKCVLLRSAIAAAALSISSEGINNRNRIILNEEEAARTVSKIMGEDFMGNDEEVISKIMALE